MAVEDRLFVARASGASQRDAVDPIRRVLRIQLLGSGGGRSRHARGLADELEHLVAMGIRESCVDTPPDQCFGQTARLEVFQIAAELVNETRLAAAGNLGRGISRTG